MNAFARILAASVIVSGLALANGCAAPQVQDDEVGAVFDGAQCKASTSAPTCASCCAQASPSVADQLAANLKTCNGQQGFDFFDKILDALVDAGTDAAVGAIKGAVGGGDKGGNATPPKTPATPSKPATPAPKKKFKGFYGGPGNLPGVGTTKPAALDPNAPAAPDVGDEGDGNQFAGPTCVADVKADCRKNAECAQILACIEAASCNSKE
jgi:hypothetical protein